MKEIWTDEFINEAKERSKLMALSWRIIYHPQEYSCDEISAACLIVAQNYNLISELMDLSGGPINNINLDEIFMGIYHLEPSRQLYSGYSVESHN